MNKDRRSRLRDVGYVLDDAINELSEIIDEEQEAFDNLPEGLQTSSRGEAMEDYIGDIQLASDEIENLIQELNEIADR